MDLETLETWERELVGQCLRASVAGPFFPDWEFSTIFGLEREEVRAIAAAWPTIGDRASAEVAINNALNNLIGYPHGCGDVWPQWISVSPGTLVELLAKIRGAPPENYFDALR